MIKRWEYKIVSSEDVAKRGWFKRTTREALEAHLNELGTQGWELVNGELTVEAAFGISFIGVAKRER